MGKVSCSRSTVVALNAQKRKDLVGTAFSAYLRGSDCMSKCRIAHFVSPTVISKFLLILYSYEH